MAWLRKIFMVLTQKERVLFLCTASVAIVSGIVLAGLVFAVSTTPVPAYGGEYTEGFVGQPVYINPVIASSDVDKAIVRLVFSNLGDIADTIATSSDGRTWNVRLKEQLRWQDGSKLTSDDVIFTVQKIQDSESRSPLFDSWQGAGAQRISELEVQFSLINPYSFFTETLKILYILPKHIFSEVPPANWRLSDYNLKPVGSGPFKFDGYEKRPDGFITKYRLSPWETHAGGVPLIGSFDFMFFSQKPDILEAFNSGKIDGFAGLDPEQIADIKRPYETVRYTMPSYYAAFLNQNKSIPLKDIEVRKALSTSLDRYAIIQTALEGFGTEAVGPIPKGTPYFLEFPEEDISSSTAIASDEPDSPGCKMGDGGIREKTVKNTKIPLELTIAVPQIEFLTRTSHLLVRTWGELGIKVNLSIFPIDDIGNSILKNRDYEILLFGNVLSKSYDLFSFWHSSQRFYPGLNLSLYNNKKADSLIESIRQVDDKKERESQFHELQKIIKADHPATFLYSPDFIYVSSKNLRGVDPRLIMETGDRFVGAQYWYIKTARVLK